jgi:Phage P22-like portal protein
MLKDTSDLDDLALMRSRFHDAEEAETLNRVAALEAISFYYGDQWADDIERARKAEYRPCFTLNKLPSILKQILNESRANPPAIEVEPGGGGATEDTAEAVQGLTRHVETHSEAKLAYENAMEYMTIGGFASWRVDHDYLPKSFDQEIYVNPIWNPFSVYWDPASQKPDKSDARFCFVTLDLGCEEHNAEYPNSELAGLNDFAGVGDQAPGWLSKGGARVAEYYTVESKNVTLVQLEDGTTAYEDEIPKGAKIAVDEAGEPIERDDIRKTAYLAHTNGVEWLKAKKKLPTADIPIITIFGDKLIVDGELRIKGAVEDLMEPQRMFNYDSSAIAETMALGTKAQWVATAEQIEPYKEIWKQSSSRNLAVLPYKFIPGVPPPAKIATEPPIQAMSAVRMMAADDLRSISGVYDGTQAPNNGEESGKAILARRHQASQGNINYTGNLARGVKRTADILLGYFPVFYDKGRVFRILGTDRQPKNIAVHAGRPETLPTDLPDDISGVFDLNVGNHSVTVSVAKSWDTVNQETLDMMLSLVEAEPNLAPILGDLIVGLMNFPGKQAFVDRLQKALPPNLQDQKDPTDPAQLQQHNSMLMQGNQKLMAQVQQLTQMMQTKQIEGQSRERVEAMKLQATQIMASARTDQARIQAQVSILKESAGKQFDAVHDHAMSTKEHVHSRIAAAHDASLLPPPVVPAPAGMTQ